MSAGQNVVVTLPEDAVELKAFVVPAPPAGESVTSLRDARAGPRGCSSRALPGLPAARIHFRNTAQGRTEGSSVLTRLWWPEAVTLLKSFTREEECGKPNTGISFRRSARSHALLRAQSERGVRAKVSPSQS